MPYIKAQKIVKDNTGLIVSGSAAIIDSEYVPNVKNHSKKHVRERLGKVLYLSEDKKTGIFESPTRGLCEYCSLTDTFSSVDPEDPRLKGSTEFPEPQIHTIFGDVYLLLEFLEITGLLRVLREVFGKKELFEKVLVHILHGVLSVGSHIKCDDFLQSSFASYLFKDIPLKSLKSDSSFFSQMGNDSLKVDFFRKFIALAEVKAKKSDPLFPDCQGFGKGCYVDSTPLPNEIRTLMSNAYCSHGTAGSCMQTRLYMVLDDSTDLPVWYGTTPGNVLDLNTINTITTDTFISVGIEIDSMVLDAGYISKEFLQAVSQKEGKTFIGKSPQRRGFQFKTLYHQVKDLIPNAKYEIFRNGKAYFAIRRNIELFGNSFYAYIYVDQFNALSWHTDYVARHQDEFEAMSDKDKNWNRIKNGFFVLLTNIDDTCLSILNRYISRVEIEKVFKTSKDNCGLLPLSKWNAERINGKMFCDMIVTIIVLLLRKVLIPAGYSLPDFVGKPRSLMCCKGAEEKVIIEYPNKQVKEMYKLFGLNVPGSIDLKAYKARIYGNL